VHARARRRRAEAHRLLDGHEVRSQAYVELAVAQARRGWLTKADVANTRTWKQLEKLRKKRP
jgi:ribonuclease HI